jgi:hypothetical protein
MYDLGNYHNCSTLSSLGERIWSEWKKILSGRIGGLLTLKMVECDLGPYMGLPNSPRIEELERVWRLKENSLHHVTLLTSLLHNQDEMMKVHLVMGSNNGFKIYQTTNNFELFYQIIQIIQIIFYKVNFSYLFSVHCIFSPILAYRPTKNVSKCTPYTIPAKKIVSQNCPKMLKIVYFCPKSPPFELFELFDINLSNND